ncbi:MAG: hypothetical protein LAT64_07305 [Phycisphaerales bacterium]|nr:hypothetical protein [Planctomycetota bacterium]MCH8508563.1 hypothetical protein [Phycisphaerales bacterium]
MVQRFTRVIGTNVGSASQAEVAIARGDAGPCDLEEIAKDWQSVDWRENFDWLCSEYIWPEINDGFITIEGMLHPDSRTAERLRIIIEFKHDGPDPFIEIEWHNGPSRTHTDSKPIQDEPGWHMMMLTGIRDGDNPFGACLDMFTYTVRDVEVRRFQIADIGPIGDLNLDGVVDELDLQIVLANMALSGDLEVEDGDANGDGVVDANDLNAVIQSMPE